MTPLFDLTPLLLELDPMELRRFARSLVDDTESEALSHVDGTEEIDDPRGNLDD